MIGCVSEFNMGLHLVRYVEKYGHVRPVRMGLGCCVGVTEDITNLPLPRWHSCVRIKRRGVYDTVGSVGPRLMECWNTCGGKSGPCLGCSSKDGRFVGLCCRVDHNPPIIGPLTHSAEDHEACWQNNVLDYAGDGYHVCVAMHPLGKGVPRTKSRDNHGRDLWAPLGDRYNRWVQISDDRATDGHVVCRTVQDPTWGQTSGGLNFYGVRALCCRQTDAHLHFPPGKAQTIPCDGHGTLIKFEDEPKCIEDVEITKKERAIAATDKAKAEAAKAAALKKARFTKHGRALLQEKDEEEDAGPPLLVVSSTSSGSGSTNGGFFGRQKSESDSQTSVSTGPDGELEKESTGDEPLDLLEMNGHESDNMISEQHADSEKSEKNAAEPKNLRALDAEASDLAALDHDEEEDSNTGFPHSGPDEDPEELDEDHLDDDEEEDHFSSTSTSSPKLQPVPFQKDFANPFLARQQSAASISAGASSLLQTAVQVQVGTQVKEKPRHKVYVLEWRRNLKCGNATRYIPLPIRCTPPSTRYALRNPPPPLPPSPPHNNVAP